MWKDVLATETLHNQEPVAHVSDILVEFKQFALTKLVGEKSMITNNSKADTLLRVINKNIDNFKCISTCEEKNELFRHLLGYYLMDDVSTPIMNYFNAQKSIENRRLQESLLQNSDSRPMKQAPMFQSHSKLLEFKTQASITTQKAKSDSFHNHDQSIIHLINRTFFKLNFYSTKYLDIFFEEANKLYENYVKTQETLSTYMGHDKKLLNEPFGAKISEFLRKMGPSFKDMLPTLETEYNDIKNTYISRFLNEYIQSYYKENPLP